MIDDFKVCRFFGKGMEWFYGRIFIFFEFYKDFFVGELGGLIFFKRSVNLFFGIL